MSWINSFIQLYRAKRKEKKLAHQKRREEISVTREWFELIAETLIYVFFIMTFLVQSFVIPTGSMIDNLLIGDHLVVDKVAYSRSHGFLDGFLLPQQKIRRGMIVTFKSPAEIEKEYVKRVIGLPGDTIKIIKKQVYINDEPIEEPYKRHRDMKGYAIEDTDDMYYIMRDNFPLDSPYGLPPQYHSKYYSNLVSSSRGRAFRVPEGHYFCMGDNRDNSSDSRFWGPVPEDYIIGKPWRIYWSYESSTEEYLTPGILHKIKDLFRTIIHFFSKTRWKRTIKKIT
jgi:signal peptidase I